MSAKNIAVIGLGSMGYGIAQSALRDGHKVWGRDVVEATTAKFIAEGGEASTPNYADIDVAVLVVLNASQTEDVLFGEKGIAALMRKGTTIIACATVPPEFARDMETRTQARGLHYLDAPISGGAVKAADGALSIMASGSGNAFEGAQDVMDSIAETVFSLGDQAGAGSAMKAVNQMLAGVHIAAMAEAITFGMTQGVSPASFIDVISKCAGTSWMLENRAPHIASGDYTPRSSVNIWPKDLGIVLDIADQANFDAPITKTALAQYGKAVQAGLGLEDDAAVAKVYAAQAELSLPKGKPS
jgi:3-hydroxyisobutyrate dehydrogenase-like beta-hydroxyacid dehydrogenase